MDSESKPTHERIGPYRLLRRIGFGGMAETFEAERETTGGPPVRVCLKRVLPSFAGDKEFVRMFRAEAEILGRLRHRNITMLMDFGELAGTPYLAMEYVDGIDLRGLLDGLSAAQQRDARSAASVALVGIELCRALDYAHRQGVVHRDLSPSNVLVSREGEIKLSDFGIAKMVDQARVTGTGVLKGKLYYIAPEYAAGGPASAAGDLFSLGVVLFEMLSGRRPYEGAHDIESLLRAQQGEHEFLAKLAPDAPDALIELIEDLIVPEPGRRPSDAQAVLERLAPLAPPLGTDRRFGSWATTARAQAQAIEADLARDAIGSAKTKPGPTGQPIRGETQALPGSVSAEPSSGPTVRTPERAGPADRTRTIARAEVAEEPGSARTQPAEATGPMATPPVKPSAKSITTLAVAALLGGAASVVYLALPGTQAPAPAAQRVPDAHVSAIQAAQRVPDAHVSAIQAAQKVPDAHVSAIQAAQKVPDAPLSAPATVQKVPDSTPPTEDSGPAILQVTVVPFGKVWIDGVPRGTSPLSVRVPAGRHRIEGGQTSPRWSKTVTVRAGRRTRIELP